MYTRKKQLVWNKKKDASTGGEEVCKKQKTRKKILKLKKLKSRKSKQFDRKKMRALWGRPEGWRPIWSNATSSLLLLLPGEVLKGITATYHRLKEL